MDIKGIGMGIWIGFKWIRTGTNGRHLSTVIKFFIKQGLSGISGELRYEARIWPTELVACLTHCGRVTQICVFNAVKLGTSASSP